MNGTITPGARAALDIAVDRAFQTPTDSGFRLRVTLELQRCARVCEIAAEILLGTRPLMH